MVDKAKKEFISPREKLTYNNLKDLFYIDRDTGKLFRIMGGCRTKYMPDGSVWLIKNSEGCRYLVSVHSGKTVDILWLSYILNTEEKPSEDRMIIPINGDYSDYRFENLRVVDRNINQPVAKNIASTKKSVFPLGVFRKDKRYFSQISFKKKRYFLGYFDTIKETSEQYQYVRTQLNIYGTCTFTRNGNSFTIS